MRWGNRDVLFLSGAFVVSVLLVVTVYFLVGGGYFLVADIYFRVLIVCFVMMVFRLSRVFRYVLCVVRIFYLQLCIDR